MDVKMFLCSWVRRVADCVVGGSFRVSHLLGDSSRTASLLLGFGGVWVDVKMFLCLKVRRAADCVVGGSLRASHRLGRRISDCVVASRVWGCVGGC